MDYKKKYLKYKKKYLNINGGAKKLILNKSNYIDTLKLNDANIFINKTHNLKIIRITPKNILYRGFSNKTCSEVAILPSSINNQYLYEPIWFGPPEVTIIYCAMNIKNELLQRYYIGYIEKIDNIDIDNMFKLYKEILLSNISSNVAYSPVHNYDLVDINDCDNLKKIIELFNKNWTVNNYNKLLKLKRISPRIKDIIGNNISFIDNSIKYNKYPNIENNKKLGNEAKNYFNKMGSVIEWGFRNAFAFGKYYSLIKNKYVPRKAKNNYSVQIEKFYLNKVDNDKIYDNIDINALRVLRNIESTMLPTSDKTKINQITEKYNNIYTNKINELKQKIATENNKLNMIALNRIEQFKKQTEIKNKYTDIVIDRIKIYQQNLKIGKLPKNNYHGYIITLKNNSILGFERVLKKDGTYELNKYNVVFKYNRPSQNKFKNPSIEKDNDIILQNAKKECKLCKLVRTSDWITENYKTNLSHLKGLSNNFTYYDYNEYTNNLEKIGTGFQQLYGKNMQFGNEERILVIPYNHIGTMSHHPDCNINSTIYPPNGSYHPTENKYNCGALIYKNSLDDEVINNMFGTYNAALTYAYLKSGKKHYVAEINRNVKNGKYYKYKNPADSGNPLIYLFFHIKANSEPHLHMHTIIDSDGTNLKNIINSTRIQVDGYSIENNDILNNNNFNNDNFVFFDNTNIMDEQTNEQNDEQNDEQNNEQNDDYNLYGGSIVTEIFGSDDYSEYSDKTSKNIKLINYIGDRKANENTPYNKINWYPSKEWVDKFNIKSTINDINNKYDFAGSFEYLFKIMIGIDENDERIKHEYIFPEPFYSLHEDLFFDQHKLFDNEISEFFNSFSKERAIEQSKLFYPTINYKPYTTQQNIGLTDIYESTDDLSKSYVKYGDYDDESHIIRQSTTINDSVAMLLMQIAFIKDTNIAGYYGHSAPLLNSYKNITHTEIGIFNSLDYPMKPVSDALYSTCNLTSYTQNNINEIVFAVYLNMIYHSQSQLKYNKTNDSNVFIERDIINDFMNSDTIQHGGKLKIKQQLTNHIVNKLDIKTIKTDTPLTDNIFKLSNYEIISKYNQQTQLYKIENNELTNNIINAIKYGAVPIDGHINTNYEFIETNKKC